MDLQRIITDYAQLIIEVAVNVSSGQTVVINAPVECFDFARKLAVLAYEREAKEVEIKYYDNQIKKTRLLKTELAVLTEIPQWKVESKEYYARKKATIISIDYVDPELYSGVDPKKFGQVDKASSLAYKDYMEIIMAGECPWVIVAYPSLSWARMVFPDIEEALALEKLWQAVLHAVRLDQPDPVMAWQKHKLTIGNKVNYLNSKGFSKLIFKNSIGTDLVVGLPTDHLWVGVSSKTSNGFEYIPNMPTEEVFCMPHKYQVNGTLVSTKPLNYEGQLVKDFRFEFKNGELIEYAAKTGQDVLDNIISIDKGAKYLGEVALVPYHSPISNLNLMFYETLFDENASCHFALGKAYVENIKNGKDLSTAEMESRGVNDSLTHVDFMIGSKDLNITGIDKDGNEVQVFRNGDWAF